MFLSYNGISMQIVKVSQYDAVATYDEAGVNYLYDAIDITCECILNPDATTKEQFGKVEPNAKKKPERQSAQWECDRIGWCSIQWRCDRECDRIGWRSIQSGQQTSLAGRDIPRDRQEAR